MLKVGKRYSCETCGTQVLIVKPGTGEPSCHGKALKLEEAKKVASSD